MRFWTLPQRPLLLTACTVALALIFGLLSAVSPENSPTLGLLSMTALLGMTQMVDAPTKSYTASGAIGKFLRVKLDSNDKLAKATAADIEIGVIRDEAFADGDVRSVLLRSKEGTTKMVADEAISKGSRVYGAAGGKVTDKPNGNYLGRALDGASGDGSVIEVLYDFGDEKRVAAANTETLSGNKTLTASDARIQALDPGGAGRDVNLPAEADANGLEFIIANTADAAEVLTVKDDGGGTIVTPAQNETAWVFCDGTSWRGIVGDSN